MMSSHSFGKFCIRHDIPCIRHCEIPILVSERRLLGEPNVGEEPDGDATEKIDDKPKDRGVKYRLSTFLIIPDAFCFPPPPSVCHLLAMYTLNFHTVLGMWQFS
jgi:hypothetical protein